jgi:hypothetical protein
MERWFGADSRATHADKHKLFTAPGCLLWQDALYWVYLQRQRQAV